MFKWILKFFPAGEMFREIGRRGGTLHLGLIDIIIQASDDPEASYGTEFGIKGDNTLWGKKLNVFLEAYAKRETDPATSDNLLLLLSVGDRAFEKACASALKSADAFKEEVIDRMIRNQRDIQRRLYGNQGGDSEPFQFEKPPTPAPAGFPPADLTLQEEGYPATAEQFYKELEEELEQPEQPDAPDPMGELINQGMKCGSEVRLISIPDDSFTLQHIGLTAKDLAWLNGGLGLVTSIHFTDETISVKFRSVSSENEGKDRYEELRELKALRLPASSLQLIVR